MFGFRRHIFGDSYWDFGVARLAIPTYLVNRIIDGGKCIRHYRRNINKLAGRLAI